MAKLPLDTTPYPRDPNSCPIQPGLKDGLYVYVQDILGVIFVLPDGGHLLHPKVLGGGQPAMYAGDLRIANGCIADVTNLSGTFQFDDEQGLLNIAVELTASGFVLNENAVRFFPMNGSAPKVLK